MNTPIKNIGERNARINAGSVAFRGSWPQLSVPWSLIQIAPSFCNGSLLPAER
jgi:hypothetical protein